MSVDALKAGLTMEWPFETFPEYLDVVEQRGCAVNVAALIGHTALRMYVMGEDSVERDATPEEIAAQRASSARRSTPERSASPRSKANTHVGYDGKPVPSRIAHPGGDHRDRHGAGRGRQRRDAGHRGTRAQPQRVRPHRRAHRPDCVVDGVCCPGHPDQDYHEELRRGGGDRRARGLHVFPQVAVQPIQFEMNWKAPFIYEALRCFNPVSKADLEGKKAHLRRPGVAGAVQGEGRQRAATSATGGPAPPSRTTPPTPRCEGTQRAGARRCSTAATPSTSMIDLALDADLDMRIVQDVINYDPDTHPGAAVRPDHGHRPVRRRGPRQPAVRRQVLHRVPVDLRAGSAELHARTGRAHADPAPGAGVRHHRPGHA